MKIKMIRSVFAQIFVLSLIGILMSTVIYFSPVKIRATDDQVHLLTYHKMKEGEGFYQAFLSSYLAVVGGEKCPLYRFPTVFFIWHFLTTHYAQIRFVYLGFALLGMLSVFLLYRRVLGWKLGLAGCALASIFLTRPFPILIFERGVNFLMTEFYAASLFLIFLALFVLEKHWFAAASAFLTFTIKEIFWIAPLSILAYIFAAKLLRKSGSTPALPYVISISTCGIFYFIHSTLSATYGYFPFFRGVNIYLIFWMGQHLVFFCLGVISVFLAIMGLFALKSDLKFPLLIMLFSLPTLFMLTTARYSFKDVARWIMPTLVLIQTFGFIGVIEMFKKLGTRVGLFNRFLKNSAFTD